MIPTPVSRLVRPTMMRAIYYSLTNGLRIVEGTRFECCPPPFYYYLGEFFSLVKFEFTLLMESSDEL